MNRFEITRGGRVLYGGTPIELRAGDVIDDGSFDVADLRRQGCVLRKLLPVRDEEPKRAIAVRCVSSR